MRYLRMGSLSAKTLNQWNACDERWRVHGVCREEEDGASRSSEDGVVICSLSLEADALLDPGHRSHQFPTQSPASCLRPKIPGCCIFVVPLQVHE